MHFGPTVFAKVVFLSETWWFYLDVTKPELLNELHDHVAKPQMIISQVINNVIHKVINNVINQFINQIINKVLYDIENQSVQRKTFVLNF